ncbi:MAG: alkaline phosphatase family protein [Candidatus Babeliaceae bacterium]|jgi:predicted AlkP superfamily pyrophosphatase or phosphodiesterase
MKKIFLCLLVIGRVICAQVGTPQLTLIIVIDQFAYHELQKLQTHFKGGIKFLHDNGITYTQAFQPHGAPVTGVGHAALATGTFPSEHGIVNNAWFSGEQKIKCDDDNDPAAAVFAPHGLYAYGRSSHHVMTDTLSDQITLSSSENNKMTSFALSLKSRAATIMAGKLGKAVWFDDASGFFTSSKSYYAALPAWLHAFNNKKKIHTLSQITWPVSKNKKMPHYNFYNNYDFAKTKTSLIGKKIPKKDKLFSYSLFQKTPAANKLLCECAQAALRDWIKNKKKDEHLIFWLSLSSLDKIGHLYGPDAQEISDMLYHMDHDLKQLFATIYKNFDKKDVLIALTADHGVHPITSLVNKQGLDFAHRISSHDLKATINAYIEKKYAYSNIVEHIKTPFIYLKQDIFSALTKEKKSEVAEAVCQSLMNYPGVKRAWTERQLIRADYQPHSLEYNFKQQLYPNRNGEIIFQLDPYTDISKQTWGTKHNIPYDDDTHVPLMLYQYGRFMHKKIATPVIIQQLPVTLAHILNVPRPSASTAELLPV